MKKRNKNSYTKSIVAGLLVAIMLLLEVVPIFATENNATELEIVTEDTIESVMSKQFGFVLNDDFITFPTTVPKLIESSNRIYPNIVSEIEAGCTATYRSSDNLFTVTFENPTNKTIDMNKAIVRSILITPQTETVLKISGLVIDNESIVTVSDLVKVFGNYYSDSVIYDETNAVLIWDFEDYLINITLKEGYFYDALVTSKEDTLPTVSKNSFYNFELGEYYKIEVFEYKTNIGTDLATTFYVTKEKKDEMSDHLFFDLYINNTYPMGYLLQNETIDMLNKDNDYETVLAELSEKMELNYYSDNATFITKSDYEIEKETNIRYIIICVLLLSAIISLILFEKRKKQEKLKRELHSRKEKRNKTSGSTDNEE